MNLDERITKKNSQTNRVKISATIGEEINILLEKTANNSKDATKELLIEMAVEHFLEEHQVPFKSITEDVNTPLYRADKDDDLFFGSATNDNSNLLS